MAAVPSYRNRWPIYADLWRGCEIRPSKKEEVARTCNAILEGKSRLQGIEKTTGVPWYVIGILLVREAGLDKTDRHLRWDRQLAQGDPLHERSHNEPISGPFATFENSAVWALHHDHLDAQIDWRVEKILYWCEAWNGWGYYLYHPRTPSSYVWGGTNKQKPGKYVADHVWSDTAMDTQLGCAAMLLGMAALDPSIKFVHETPAGTPGDEAPPVDPPTLPTRQPVPQRQRPEVKPIPGITGPSLTPKRKGLIHMSWDWINKTRDS